MKFMIHYILGLLLILGVGHAQIQSPEGRIASHGGCYISTHGTLRALLVFVQMKDDALQDSTWPLGELPSWAENYRRELTEYFRVMSNGKLNLEITQAPGLRLSRENEADYVARAQNYGQGIRDILQDLDEEMDYAPYDQWTQGGLYHISPGPDGKLDLVIVIIRGVANASFFPFSGISDMGFYIDLPVDQGARRITGGSGQYNDASKSGVTLGRRNSVGTVTDYEMAMRISIHEIMHKMYGDSHPTTYFAGLGVMGSGGGGIGLSAYERHVMGMDTLATLSATPDTIVTMTDVYSGGKAICIPVPTVEHLFYIFEFRGKQSPFDSAPSRGVFITRVYDHPSPSQRSVHIYPAEGKWQWDLDTQSGYPVQRSPDPLRGFTRYQNITIGGKSYIPWGYWGDSAMAFTKRTPHFSWFTNPTPDFIIGQDTIHVPFAMEILDMTDSSATVSFHPPRRGTLAAPDILPSVPLNCTVFPQPSQRGHPLFIEVPTSETDVAHVAVIDLLGREHFHADAFISPPAYRWTLPTHDLEAGCYLVHVTTAKGRVSRLLRLLE